jgi:hypothetical protein
MSIRSLAMSVVCKLTSKEGDQWWILRSILASLRCSTSTCRTCSSREPRCRRPTAPRWARVNKLAAACRKAGVLVVHTAQATRPDGSKVGVMGDIIPPVREGMIAKGSFSAAFHRDLKIEPGDVVPGKTALRRLP